MDIHLASIPAVFARAPLEIGVFEFLCGVRFLRGVARYFGAANDTQG